MSYFYGFHDSPCLARSKDVRAALRALPAFFFTTELWCTRQSQDWQGTRELLEAVAQTKGSQCFISAELKEEGVS